MMVTSNRCVPAFMADTAACIVSNGDEEALLAIVVLFCYLLDLTYFVVQLNCLFVCESDDNDALFSSDPSYGDDGRLDDSDSL